MTKPCFAGIQHRQENAENAKKNNRNVLNFVTIGKLLQPSWDFSDYPFFIVTDL